MTTGESTPRSRPLSGVMTALATPFRDGELDREAWVRLIERQIAGGVDWIVPCGTTGESPTLTQSEFRWMVQSAVQTASGRCGVLANTGTNCTQTSMERTRLAAECGAEAVMLVVPYYNRPPAEGLFQHFATIARQTELPVVLYDVPARTAVTIPHEVVARLRGACENIVAIKHATGSVDGVADLIRETEIAVLSGDDSLTWPLMALGACGVISVVSNLVPRWMRELVDAAATGDLESARRAHGRIALLADGLARFGPNPIPIKSAMELAGHMAAEFRLPLCGLSDDKRVELQVVLRGLEVTRG